MASASAAVDRVQVADLSRPTPCGDWNVAHLLAHMSGQNLGFALAVSTGDAPKSSYALPSTRLDELGQAWSRSAGQVTAAFDAADLDRAVTLIEINPDSTFSAAVAIGMHLLDTVIHTWDVAASLGHTYRPGPELIDIVAAQASRVPVGSARTQPGSAFGPVIATAHSDPWLAALAALGRSQAD